jgi:hypothetical protein
MFTFLPKLRSLKLLKTLVFTGILVLCISGILVGQQSREVSAQSVDNGQYLKQQQEDLLRVYSSGLNRRLCLNILRGVGGGGQLLPWAQIFNIPYWVPVVPTECVQCIENNYANNPALPEKWPNGKTKYKWDILLNTTQDKPATPTPDITECPGGDGLSVPLPANLIPHIIIRLYGLLASISLYGLGLVFGIVGIRYLVGGLAKGGRYTDTAKDLRNVSSALIITLTIGTLLLQILFSVVSLPAEATLIYQACIPTTDPSKANNFSANTNGTDKDFCQVQP